MSENFKLISRFHHPTMWISGEEQAGAFNQVEIHASYGILAASSSEGISLYNEELQYMQNLIDKKEASIDLLLWHPLKRILAITWSSGCVGLWCLDLDGVLREGNAHQSKIVQAKWSPSGHRLITGDEEGVVIVWKVENKGRISVTAQYRLHKSPIVEITFKGDKEKRSNKVNCTIFIALKDGKIYYADDVGHCDELTCMTSKINSFIFRESEDELLVVTEDLVLSHFKLLSDGKLKLGNSVKLSGGMSTKGQAIETKWIGSELLVWSISGDSPHIWDIENEETQILDGGELAANPYKCLSYNPKSGMISCATESGNIVLWRQTANSSDKKWEVR